MNNAQHGHVDPVSLSLFVTFLCLTLVVTWWAAKRTKTTDDFFAAGGSIGPLQNGIALAGDFVAAAGFLGI